jgi:hypothetical protein
MATHVQEIRFPAGGASLYALYHAPVGGGGGRLLRITDRLSDAERLLSELPKMLASADDRDMYQALQVALTRSGAWQEPTHAQVFRAPMRSDRSYRRLVVLWAAAGGELPAAESDHTHTIKPLPSWLPSQGVIVDIVAGYIGAAAQTKKLTGRWTNVAGFNALDALRDMLDGQDEGSTARQAWRAAFVLPDRPKKEQPISTEPKARRGKWKRPPRTKASE